MNTIKPIAGDFGLTQIAGTTGKLIRIGQWLNGDGFANYEHAFIYIGNDQIVEAEPGGARIAKLSKYQSDSIHWSTGHFSLTENQRTQIVHAAIGYLGVPYSFLDYASLAARRLDIPVPGLHSYIKSTKHMICSQLVDQCYQDVGCHIFNDPDRWPGDVTPEALYNATI